MNSGKMIKNIEASKPLQLGELLDYREGEVVSRTLAQHPTVNVTLFSMAQGEGISAHSAPGDAMVQILDGEAEITIGDEVFTVKNGEAIVMPANIPHALAAKQNFKMLLTVVKPAQ